MLHASFWLIIWPMGDGGISCMVLAAVWQGGFCVAFLAACYCTFADIRDPLWNNQQTVGLGPSHFCQWCRCVCRCRACCCALTPLSCNVRPDSKHCRICNRCVCGFDHHCIWLNVCVARRTYRAFLVLLLSLIASCTAHGISSGAPAPVSSPLSTCSLSAGLALHRASLSLTHAWWPATPHLAVFVVAAVALLLCVLVRGPGLLYHQPHPVCAGCRCPVAPPPPALSPRVPRTPLLLARSIPPHASAAPLHL